MQTDATTLDLRPGTTPDSPGHWRDIPTGTLLNGLLREWKSWNLLSAAEAQALDPGAPAVIALNFVDQGARVLIGLQRSARTGRHRFRWPMLLQKAGARPTAVGLEGLLDLLLNDSALMAQTTSAKGRLFRQRVQASAAAVQAILVARGSGSQAMLDGPADFLTAEQGLLLGHAFHPAPKHREGMIRADEARYSPDDAHGFALHWFAVHPDHIAIGELAAGSAAAQVGALWQAGPSQDPPVPAVPAGWALLPAHPWQAARLHDMPAVRQLLAAGMLRDLGIHGDLFYATASFRCVYSRQAAHMLKFSLSCRITNSVRVMLPRELGRGLQFARVLQGEIGDALQRDHPDFTVIDEPSHLSLRSLAGEIIAESSVILRDNPFREGGPQAELLAFLCQDDPQGGRSRLGRGVAALAARLHRPEAEIGLLWFERFLALTLGPLLALQADHGLLMTAHQQNLLLATKDGWPAHVYFRDCQGTGCSSDRLAELERASPGYGAGTECSIPEELVPRLFGYYIVANTVLGVLDTLLLDAVADEDSMLAALRSTLQGHLGKRDDRVVRYLLDAEHLWLKGNLTTYLRDVDENASDTPVASYVTIANPIARP